MPPATSQKTPEVPKKPPFEVPLSVESKKSLSDIEPKSADCTSRPTGGAGETVIKKPAKKPPKTEEDKSGKKASSAVIDRVPKKNAQRAKGSTSLNKTIEKTNAEPTDKKKPPAEAADKPEKPSTDGKKFPRKTSKTKVPLKKPLKKDSKIPRTPQSWMNAKLNSGIEEEKPLEPPCEEAPEVPPEEIRAVNGPFSSCSFFEKIQQGVKAYFNSRNSFTPGEKNKKEGAERERGQQRSTPVVGGKKKFLQNKTENETRSQTRARVAKGVKEDATKREPGFVFKNKISDSVGHHERLRVNSSLGGDSNNFSRAKPLKIFRKLKRKKLYRPKKHCVRIQIPRKGYFYRSTVQFKNPEPATSSGQFHRVDPFGVPKNEPKVQISGLAATGSKKSDLPNKKRLKKKKRFNRSVEGERQKCDVSERASVAGDSFETLVNCLNSTLDEELMHDLEITQVNKVDTVFAYHATAITETLEPTVAPTPDWVKDPPGSFNSTSVLMDGIDLHSELQNYLRAFDPKPNEFDDASSFRSATSIPEVLVMLERDAASASEEYVPTSRSQAEIREIKSEYESRSSFIKRTFGNTSFDNFHLDSTNESMNSIDSYEKILPLYSKSKNKSGVLYENVVYALSEESESKSDTNQSQTTQPTSGSRSSENLLPNIDSQWCPTLQDLTEIYDSVLKQHEKIRKNSRNSVSNCISSQLISFLNKKLQEKQFKADLIKLSKRITKTPVSHWKPFKGNSSLKGYVNKFQELLQSPLSIKQITRLNKIMSTLQKNRQVAPAPIEKILKGKPKKPDSKSKQSHKVQKVQKVKLSSPRELDHMLKTSFNSEDVVCTDPELTDIKNKVLVNVKLHGDQVLVNNLTYFESESLLSNKPKPKGTSELIIENVTKDQVTGFWYKKTKSSKLREQIHKKPEKKPRKTKKAKPEKPPRRKNELENFLQFHYDQMLLRTQHPIDSIIESPEPEIDPEALNDALAENALSEGFLCDFNWMKEEVENCLARTMSSTVRTGQKPKKKNRPEAVRSMVDLKERPIFPRPRTAILCFPSLQKPEKPWKDKTAGISVSPPKTSLKPETTPSSNTVLYLNSEVVPECCSIELLFSEDNPSACSNGSVVEPFEPSTRSSSPGTKDPPIVLHPHNAAMTDFSFPSMIIRSDSFLKCIQHPGVSRGEMKSLFKSNSDTKFYPGRLTDSGAEEIPFVTFVLTPEQKKVAGLEEKQIQVVNKTKNAVVDEIKMEKEVPVNETNKEVPLDSIEKFINELSKCRARVARQKLKSQHLTTKPNPNLKQKPARTQSTPPKIAQFKVSQIYGVSDPKPPPEDVKKLPAIVSKKPQSRNVRIARKPTKKCERSIQKRTRKEPEVKRIKKKPQNPEVKDSERETKSLVPPEVVEALKTAIARSENFPNKPEIMTAIGKAFDKPEMSRYTRKQLKVVKIKILCNEHKCLKESKDAGSVTEEIQDPPPAPPAPPAPPSGFRAPAEILLLDSLVAEGEGEGGGEVERKESTYFDALETADDDESNDFLKVQLGLQDDPLKDAEEPEERILRKISESLKEEDISLALELLNVYLKNERSSFEKSSANLKNLLLLIENKCRSLMIKIERNAWLKVLSLLEEASRMLESDHVESKKARIGRAKDCLEKIQQLNVSRLIDLQSFCCSLSDPPDLPAAKNVFGKIRDALKLLREKFSSRRHRLESSDQLEIHSTLSLPELREAFAKKSELEKLKKKIQEQKTSVEGESVGVPAEIQDVKDKVAEKVRGLRKALADFEWGGSSRGMSAWWRREEKEEGGSLSLDGPGRDEGSAYRDLMQCLMKDDEDNPEELTTTYLGSKSRTNVKSAKSLVRVQNPSVRILNSRNEIFRDGLYTSTSKTEPEMYSKSRERMKQHSKVALRAEGKVFSTPEFLLSDCWKANSAEIPVKLVEIFKDNNPEEKDSDVVPVRKRKLSVEEDTEKLSYTKEFHLLTEVQKAKILTAVEDVIKKLANADVGDLTQATQSRRVENPSFVSDASNIEKYLCKKFLLPWVIMKLVEMILCHVTQITFLSNDVFLLRKNEFLPVVVTYYLTLFIVVVSLVLHMGCYSYVGIQNPCYFMGVISSSILTLTTTLGIFVILCSMEYYKSFREILVLVFIGALLGTLVVELCICYIEVKNFWSRAGPSEQCYIP